MKLSTITLEQFVVALVDFYLNPLSRIDGNAVEPFKDEREEQGAAFMMSAIIDYVEVFLKNRGLQ